MTRGKDHLLNLQGSPQGPWKGTMTGTVASPGKRPLLHLVVCTMREGDSDYIDLIMLSATEVLPGENDNGIRLNHKKERSTDTGCNLDEA